MPARQSTHFVLTFNDLDQITWEDWPGLHGDYDGEYLQFPQHPDERYAIWALEVGNGTGNLHVQAYIATTKRRTPVSVANWFRSEWGSYPNCQIAESPEKARLYVDKPNNPEKDDGTNVAGPWERGDYGRVGQGKRNDLADACQTLRETKSMKAVAESHPGTFVRNHKGLREYQKEMGLVSKPRDLTFKPRPWQQRLMAKLAAPAGDRKIIWVHDHAGNTGKSRLARHLVLEHNAIVLEGKIADMAFMYTNERIAIFDISRPQAEYSKHLCSFAEKLKNGFLVSTKYESGLKQFDPPHVVFFANFEPEDGVWTGDRLDLMDLAEPRWHSSAFLPALAGPSASAPPAQPSGFVGAYGSDHPSLPSSPQQEASEDDHPAIAFL